MKKFILFLLTSTLFLSIRANAQPIASLGAAMLYEFDNDGRSLDIRQPISFRAGYRFLPADVFIELVSFQATDGTSMVQVSRVQTELLLWTTYSFLRKAKINPYWAPYAGAGFGFNYQRVETNFSGDFRVDQGQSLPMMAFNLGLEASIAKSISFQLEGRLATSNGYAPNPLMGFGGHALFRF